MGPGIITSLLPDGTTNPGALNIELDLAVYGAAVGDTSSYVRIWGLGLAELAQAFDLNGQSIKVFGGMAKGYPLADPSQQGLLVQGEISQAFGNWIGIDQTLDLYLRPPTGTIDQPQNYTFTWAKGEKLADMLARTLKTVAPGLTQQITTSDHRVANADKPGYYATLTQFAQQVGEMTAGELNANDAGVSIVTDGQVIRAFEASPTTAPSGSRAIKYQDLLGQPTWAAPQQLTAKLVMRGDLQVGDFVTFPEGLLLSTSQNAMPAFGGVGSKHPANSLSFGKGTFLIVQMQHWGNFRQPDAMSWNTTIWATLLQPTG